MVLVGQMIIMACHSVENVKTYTFVNLFVMLLMLKNRKVLSHLAMLTQNNIQWQVH